MTITRLHIGPRMSQAVVHGSTVYLAGQVADQAKALSDKIGPIAAGIRLARQDRIPSEDHAMTVRHSASAAERLCL